MKLLNAGFVAFLIWLSNPFPSTAAELDEGIKAYNRRDYKLALQLLLPLAEQGVARAQNDIGVMYATGRGVDQDDAQAATWFQRGADQGYVRAQEHLGYAYRKGLGVSTDYIKAVALFKTAADQGDVLAQTNLATMYRTGEGVARDDVKAAEYYRKAADQGNAIAQNNLGSMYAKGEGVLQDYVQAAEWYGRAADQGTPVPSFLSGPHTSEVLAFRKTMCRRTNGLPSVMRDIGLGMRVSDGKPNSFAS
jgi:TPR repeat protein